MRIIGCAALLSCGGSDKTLAVRNTAPAVTIQAPTSGSEFDEGEIITYQAIIGDDADSPLDLSLTWASDVDGAFEHTSVVDVEGNVTWSTSNLTEGNHTITLQVVDTKGLSASDAIAISVLEVDHLPDISMIHPSGDEYGMEGEPFDFVVQVHDEQDNPEGLSIEFESDIDGVFCTPMADDIGVASCEVELSVTSGISEDHFLVYTVTDSDGNSRSTDPKAFVVASLRDSDDDGDGFTENEGDCDDSNAGINPAADEVAHDGIDQDCDGADLLDGDGDGYNGGPGGDDCDDTDPSAHPGGIEICDLTDNDCNGITDDEGAAGCTIYYLDADGDGYGSADAACYCSPTGDYSSTLPTDCYDGNASAYPGAGGWYSTHRGDGSYDWNCDGSQEYEYTAIGSCGGWPGCGRSSGWSGSVAACGTTGSWLDDCDTELLFSCSTDYSARAQRCR
jgi:hypothetical protein